MGIEESKVLILFTPNSFSVSLSLTEIENAHENSGTGYSSASSFPRKEFTVRHSQNGCPDDTLVSFGSTVQILKSAAAMSN